MNLGTGFKTTFRIDKAIHAFRVKEWWNYKIPPLWAIYFLPNIYCFDIRANSCELLKQGGVVFWWMLASASLGYFINDVTDRQEDEIVSKVNHTKGLPTLVIIPLILFLIAMALAPISLVSADSFALAASIGQIVCFFLYSVPPFRFKRYKIPSILLDALYAHLLPSAVVLCLCKNKLPIQAFAVVLCWQFVVGIRNMLLHHIASRNRDSLLGNANFALATSPLLLLRSINTKWVVLEVSFLFLALGLINKGFLIATIVLFALHASAVYIRSRGTRLFSKLNATYLLVNNFYEQYLPCSVLLFCSFLVSNLYLILLLVFLLLFPASLRIMKEDLITFVRFLYSRL